VIGRIYGNALIMDAWACKCTHPKGWVISKATLEQNLQAGIIEVEVRDHHDLVYTVSISRFLKFGKYINRKSGDKLCLAMIYWEVSKR
jgi:hypothetical protein